MAQQLFVIRLTRIVILVLAVLATLGTHATMVSAQGTVAPAQQDLKTRIERRYEALPLHNGVLLKSRSGQVNRSIELSDSMIALNGVEVTGAELRQQLGADADLVLQLSYLDPSAQRALFGLGSQTIASPPAAIDRRAERRVQRGGRVRFGGDVFVGPDEVLADDVVVFGGTARIEGEVDGDVVVIGGRAELGPKAFVRKGLTVVGGTLQRDPGAIVNGEVTEVGSGSTGLGTSGGSVRRGLARLWPFDAMRPFVRFAATGLRIAALILLAFVVILLARQPIERIGARAAAEPLKAGLVGLLLELLFIPTLIVTVVLLVVTIIGIPLLVLVPFALLALVIVLLMGFTAVAYRVGELVVARSGWSSAGPYLATGAGIVIVFAPLLLARILGLALGGLALVTIPLAIIGGIVEYAAWTIGLGAAALDRFRPQPSPAPTA